MSLFKPSEIKQIEKDAVARAKKEKLASIEMQKKKDIETKERQFQQKVEQYTYRNITFSVGQSGYVRFLSFMNRYLNRNKSDRATYNLEEELKNHKLEGLRDLINSTVEKPEKKPVREK